MENLNGRLNQLSLPQRAKCLPIYGAEKMNAIYLTCEILLIFNMCIDAVWRAHRPLDRLLRKQRLPIAHFKILQYAGGATRA